MKVYEAIAMLEQVDQNKECIVTFGTPVKQDSGEPLHFQTPYPTQPMWVIGKEYWPSRNEITCKTH